MKQFLFLISFWISGEVLAREIVITKEFCDFYVIEHVPDADVEYKPDSSDDIWPPADIGGALNVKMPKSIRIPIQIDTSKYMGSLGNPADSFLDYAELGYVKVNEDGRIYFNGQPLFHEDEFAVKQACRKLRG